SAHERADDADDHLTDPQPGRRNVAPSSSGSLQRQCAHWKPERQERRRLASYECLRVLTPLAHDVGDGSRSERQTTVHVTRPRRRHNWPPHANAPPMSTATAHAPAAHRRSASGLTTRAPRSAASCNVVIPMIHMIVTLTTKSP